MDTNKKIEQQNATIANLVLEVAAEKQRADQLHEQAQHAAAAVQAEQQRYEALAQELAAAKAQQGGGELPQDERAAVRQEGWDACALANQELIRQLRAALAQRAASVPAQAGQEVPVELVDAIVHTGRGYGNSETFRPQIESLLRHFWPEAAPVPAASVQPVISALSNLLGAATNEQRFKASAEARKALADYRSGVQPEIERKLALNQVQIDGLHHEAERYKKLYQDLKRQPDIGRDAAQLVVSTGNDDPNIFTVVISLKQGDQMTLIYNKEHSANRDCVGVAELPFALATQAAPEVASVPDAGDEPVYWSVTYRGVHNANAFPTKGLAQGTLDRLNAKHPGETREIVPLYTRPQPDPDIEQSITQRDAYHDVADNLADAIAAHFGADIGEHSSANCPWDEALRVIKEAGAPAVLSDEQIDTACADVWHADHQGDSKGYERAIARAVLAAARSGVTCQQ